MPKQFIYNIYRLIVFFLFLCVISGACHADECGGGRYFSEGKSIIVSGIVRAVVFLGPPNFGENPKTDQKYTGALLYLDCPINIPMKFKSGEYDGNITESLYKNNLISIRNNKIIIINIRMETDDTKRIAYELHDGWHARITGSLREMNLPSDHSPIVLDESDTEWLRPGSQPLSYINDCGMESGIGKKVILSGVVEAMTFAGPPSFGKDIMNDSTYTGYLLFLDCPIRVSSELSKELSVTSSNKNQVADTPYGLLLLKNNKLNVIHVRIDATGRKIIDYKLHKKQCAKITGIIKKATSPLDQTPIVLDPVSDVKWLNRKRLPCLF